MASFALSPGVAVIEKDFTSIVPAVATSTGGFVGTFPWGPVLEPVTISSENVMVQRFGKPSDANATSFFTAANFLSYTSNLLLVRADTVNHKNAVAIPVDGVGIKINNTNDYLAEYVNGAGTVGLFAAKYPGALGNAIGISMADSASYAAWDYAAEFNSAPEADELHVVIADVTGAWTGTPGLILERFAYLGKASDSKKSDGTNNYYRDALNSRSKFVWWMDHPANSNWGTPALGTTFTTISTAYEVQLSGGVDDLTATDGQLMTAWNIFSDDSRYDVRLLPVGKASPAVAEFVIALAESRRDCVVFVSPEDINSGDIIIGSDSASIDAIIAYRNELPSTSYAAMDSGYKYQYDRYNDKYRWVPLNGDVAGLCARTDYQQDPWFSPGGLNRGQIKNVVKLATNPNQTDRDNLYKSGVNPVVTFPGQGTVLFGDKTLLAKPSAFDRINVRRLFIVLEKAIATAAKFQLFEFNDAFTQAQFINLVTPFLRDVQGRRGITDFVVKCDATNNTGEVIDSNQFVADIYIKPARSINFITLNFIAARSSVSFSEIGGAA
jgi:phage tail sheath protein FI